MGKCVKWTLIIVLIKLIAVLQDYCQVKRQIFLTFHYEDATGKRLF